MTYKHLMIKFNHGVEIGAHLAYLGHYARTKDSNVKHIAHEEVIHRMELQDILLDLEEKPSKVIDCIFYIVGNIIRLLCYISPEFLLNLIARTMEIFAIISYKTLANKYPKYSSKFLEMAATELEHEIYFKRNRK